MITKEILREAMEKADRAMERRKRYFIDGRAMSREAKREAKKGKDSGLSFIIVFHPWSDPVLAISDFIHLLGLGFVSVTLFEGDYNKFNNNLMQEMIELSGKFDLLSRFLEDAMNISANDLFDVFDN